MPQPGYNAAGQAQGHVDAWGRYIANRPANLTSLFGSMLNRGSSNVPVAAAGGPRNPGDIAPPGYTQAEWDAMSTTPRVVVPGRPVGSGGASGGGAGSGDRLSGDAYDAASRAQNALIGDFQASGGYNTGSMLGDVQDAGHTRFDAQSRTHGVMDGDVVMPAPGGIYSTVFRNGMGAGNPNAFRSGRFAPAIGSGDESFVGPMPAATPRPRHFTNYASRTLGY